MTDPNRTILNAMIRIQAAMAKVIHPDGKMTKDQFINEVLSAADDREVVKAVRDLQGKDDAP